MTSGRRAAPSGPDAPDNLMAVGLALFLLLLPFHLVIKKLIPGPAGTYWKEGLLALLVALWAIRCLRGHRLFLSSTPLDGAVLCYLAVLLLRFVVDRSGWVAAWGLYASVMYLPLFWLVPMVLRASPETAPPSRTGSGQALRASPETAPPSPTGSGQALRASPELAPPSRTGSGQALRASPELAPPSRTGSGQALRASPETAPPSRTGSGQALQHRLSRTTVLIALLVGAGALAALGGLFEFALNVPLWPSDEIVQRQGFPDVFIYGTHIRRVYFTFDSPTTLATTLALILPLALALFMMARTVLGRLASGLAAALMAACIVVTFSRGIWVATVLSLVGMGLLSGLVRRRWKPLPVVAGTLALIALAWGAVAVARHGLGDPTYAGVVELSPSAYAAAPVTHVAQELLPVAPLYGQAITQTWSLLDPIAGREDARPVLYHHPPESGKDEIVYAVDVPQSGALRFAIALAPETWSPAKGDGASFQVYVAEPGAPRAGQFVFVRYINPKHNPSDRRWRNFLVDLSPWAGRTVHLSLITEAGPAGDWTFDWAGWAGLQVVGVEPGTFASAHTEDAVLRHTSSVLDWVRDETNRDRLAAWSLALKAWRAAPLWGQGLGTTGVAALRTQPERAFVTESQVLKALVELGPLGLLALAYLWFQIARVGYRTYRAAADPAQQILLLGILTSLLVVFIEGLVYQNLEAKQVNAYFWTIVGTLAFLGSSLPKNSPARDGPVTPPPGAAAAKSAGESTE